MHTAMPPTLLPYFRLNPTSDCGRVNICVTCMGQMQLLNDSFRYFITTFIIVLVTYRNNFIQYGIAGCIRCSV